MKLLIATLFFFFSCKSSKTFSTQVDKSNKQEIDSGYIYFFQILDSAASVTENDTVINCCIGPISFMERTTKIPASSPGTFFGKLFFTKADLKNWHEWYNKYYKK